MDVWENGFEWYFVILKMSNTPFYSRICYLLKGEGKKEHNSVPYYVLRFVYFYLIKFSTTHFYLTRKLS